RDVGAEADEVQARIVSVRGAAERLFDRDPGTVLAAAAQQAVERGRGDEVVRERVGVEAERSLRPRDEAARSRWQVGVARVAAPDVRPEPAAAAVAGAAGRDA